MKNITRNCNKYLIFFAMFVFTWIVFAQTTPPERINYQGVLRDSNDKPLNGNITMTFLFYDDPSAGTLLWEEIYDDVVYPPEVTVTDGLFTVALGDSSHRSGGSETNFVDVFKNYTDVYLAVKVETDLEMTPRIKVISAGYALNADLLDGYHSTAFAGLIHTHAGSDITSIVSDSDKLDGQHASFFLDTSSTAQTKSAQLTLDASAVASSYGVEGRGTKAGGYFIDSDHNGYASVGYGTLGIDASGNGGGGRFRDSDGSGYTYVGYGDYGIYAQGYYAGGFFNESDGSGEAYVGYTDIGIYARGDTYGGYFWDSDGSGYAYVGNGHYGISAYGDNLGGYFKDTNSSGYAYVGNGDYGINAYGNLSGGYFEDLSSSGIAYVGYGNYGINAQGNAAGGYLSDRDHSGLAYVGYGNRGIWGRGTFAGATFSHPDQTTFWADVSTSTRKIYGTGSVSFVQNHPYDKSKVITYAAPEGDEVATYTRGRARLVNGEARIQLGDTFKWVTNPDIGLTSYVTAQGNCLGLYVESLSTTELVVREMSGGTSNVLFDYMVYGLRIGFEEIAVVQDKDREAFLPASEAAQEPYTQNPELRYFNALERFKKMRQVIGETGEIDLTRSWQLANSIDENKQEILEKARVQMEMEKKQLEHQLEEYQEPMPEVLEGIQQPHPGSPELIERAEKTIAGNIPIDEEGNIHAKSFRSVSPDLTGNVPISEPAEAGDILAIDHVNPGMMRLCDRAADPAVVGIVAGEPGVVLGGSSMSQIEKPQQEEIQAIEGEESSEEIVVEVQPAQAPIALSGIVLCKVDAAYGAILAGDLLTTSLTKGHAMRSEDHAPGTIIGKALEPWDTGTGLIKVLVFTR